MIKARASGSKVYLYFMKKGRQARHRIPRNSCLHFEVFQGLNFERLCSNKCPLLLFQNDFIVINLHKLLLASLDEVAL